MMGQELTDRVALISGAGGGIGRAIAEAYARHGAKLLLADRRGAPLQSTAQNCVRHGADVAVWAGDAANAEQSRAMVEKCVQDFGRIEVLVNSAGVIEKSPLVEMDVDQWDHVVSVNLRSVFLACRWAVPHMVEAQWGRVINIASQLGLRGGVGLSHYSAAKAGVMGFTKALAREVAKDNVLINAIAPGPVNTRLVSHLTAEERAHREVALPLGRFGEPHEIAPSAVLLASDPGGNLYVGQTLSPNSGDVMM